MAKEKSKHKRTHDSHCLCEQIAWQEKALITNNILIVLIILHPRITGFILESSYISLHYPLTLTRTHLDITKVQNIN